MKILRRFIALLLLIFVGSTILGLFVSTVPDTIEADSTQSFLEGKNPTIYGDAPLPGKDLSDYSLNK